MKAKGPDQERAEIERKLRKACHVRESTTFPSVYDAACAEIDVLLEQLFFLQPIAHG